MNQALLIIDAQQELIEGNKNEQPVFNKEQLIASINLVIEKAVKVNVPIVFIRDLDVAEGQGKGFEIHEEIKRPENYTVFDKLATNSFHGTKLLDYLQANNTKHLIIMGCKTQHCIDTAVRTATINGMDVTLISDGHSTTNSENLIAEQIIKHHNETLHGHYNLEHFSVVRESSEDIFSPTHESYR